MTTPISLPGTNRQRGYDLDHLGNWKKTTYMPVPALDESSSSSSGSADIDTLETDRRDHNSLNQITRRKATSEGPWVNFSYDRNGNLLDDGERVMAYDAFNRLCRVTRKSDDAVVGQYFYDANPARRIRKIVSNNGIHNDLPPEANGTTDFLYYPGTWQDAEDRITPDCSETSSSSTVPCSLSTKQYIWGHYIDDLIQQRDENDSGTADYYRLSNPLYTAAALTDASGGGGIVEAYDTDAYGNTLIFDAPGSGGDWWAEDAIASATPACDRIFVGYQYDNEVGLYYVRHRIYIPPVGRWAQRDPLHYAEGMNLLEYCGGTPTIARDPFGNFDAAEPWLPPNNPFWPDLPPGIEPSPPVDLGPYTPQDAICTDPAKFLQMNPFYKVCCIAHDNCYMKHKCTSKTWVCPFTKPECSICNLKVIACLIKYLPTNLLPWWIPDWGQPTSPAPLPSPSPPLIPPEWFPPPGYPMPYYPPNEPIMPGKPLPLPPFPKGGPIYGW